MGPQALQSTSVGHYALFVDYYAQLGDLLTFFADSSHIEMCGLLSM